MKLQLLNLLKKDVEDGMKQAHLDEKFELVRVKPADIPDELKSEIRKAKSDFLSGTNAKTVIFVFKCKEQNPDEQNIIKIARFFNTNFYSGESVSNISDIVFVDQKSVQYYFARIDIADI